MTIKEHYNGFGNLLDKEHRPPVSYRWALPLILFHLENSRSLVLDKKYNKENKPVDQEDMHMIPCIELEKSTKIDCKAFEDLGCKDVWKSKHPLPSLVSREHMIIRSIDGNYVYDYVRWEDYTSVLESKFKAERDKAYFSLKREADGVYLYILNDCIKSVSVEGIFHKIIDPYLFPTCDKVDFTCTDHRDFEVPISPEMLQEMYAITYQALLGVDRSADPDIVGNDSTDIINKSL